MITLLATALFLVQLVAGTVYVLYPHYLALRWGKESNRWPSIEGKIIYSRISRRAGRVNVQYVPEVKYEYTVDHKHYTCKRIEFGFFFMDEGEAQKTASRYNLGQRAIVYYNPKSPRLATLKTGISNGRLAYGFVLSAIVVGAGLVILTFIGR